MTNWLSNGWETGMKRPCIQIYENIYKQISFAYKNKYRYLGPIRKAQFQISSALTRWFCRALFYKMRKSSSTTKHSPLKSFWFPIIFWLLFMLVRCLLDREPKTALLCFLLRPKGLWNTLMHVMLWAHLPLLDLHASVVFLFKVKILK